MRALKPLVLALPLLLAAAPPVLADCDCPRPAAPENTCPVPSATHATIQDAIDDATCTVIDVQSSPSAYVEDLMITRPVHLRSASGNPADVTLQCTAAGNVTISVFNIPEATATEPSSVCIEGLTILNPRLCDVPAHLFGAGIWIANASRVRVFRNRIEEMFVGGLGFARYTKIYQNEFLDTDRDECRSALSIGGQENEVFCNEFLGDSPIGFTNGSVRNGVWRNNFRHPDASSGDATINASYPEGLNRWQDGACHDSQAQGEGFWHGPCRGNYWEAYATDPLQVDVDGDGAGDTNLPFVLVDRFPLMAPVDIDQCTPNLPPICVIRPIEPVSCDGTNNVTVDACGSFDPDDGPFDLDFAWTSTPSIGTLPNTCSFTIPLPAAGTYEFEVTVSDGQDKCTSKVFAILEDCTAPQVTCSPRSVECTDPLGTDWYPTSVFDACDPSPRVDITTSGALGPWTDFVPAATVFPLGDTFVTFTVTDDTGNSSSCSTVVTVRDTTAPVPTFCIRKHSCVTYLVGTEQAELPIYELRSFGGNDDCDPAPSCTAEITQVPPKNGTDYQCCPASLDGVPSYIPPTATDDGRYCVIPLQVNDRMALYSTCWPPPAPLPGQWPGLGRDDCGSGDNAGAGTLCPSTGGSQPTIAAGGPGLALRITCKDASGNVGSRTWRFPAWCANCEGQCCPTGAGCPPVPSTSDLCDPADVVDPIYP